MTDPSSFQPSTSFSRALLNAAKTVPVPAEARARALARLSAATASSAAASTSFVGWSLAGAGLLAAAAAAVVFVGVHGRSGARVEEPSIVAEATSKAAPPAQRPAPADRASTPAASDASECEAVEIADEPPAVCSTAGRREFLQLVNTCGAPVDVYWVDFKCREEFVGKVAPGETFRQLTFDTHPFRVRDRATHRLIKEFVGPRMPDPPDAPIQLADVVVDDRSTVPDAEPSVCSRDSYPASIRFVNDRTQGVAVIFWVDQDCKEHDYGRLEPGERFEQKTFEAHAWRVRDETGALLADVVPDADDTVYVALP